MLETIKQIFKIRYKDIMYGILFESIAFVIGLIVLVCVMKFDTGTDVTSAEAGTMIAFIVFIIIVFIQSLNSVSMHFNHAVAMGKTRKHFFAANLFFVFVEFSVMILVIYLFHCIEYNICTKIYSDVPLEVDFTNVLKLKYIVPVIVISTAVAEFVGTMFLRFGKKAFWVFWVIWMCLCLLPGRISHAMERGDASVLNKIGSIILKTVGSLTFTQWICIGYMLAAVLIAVSWLSLRKQRVVL